MNPRPYPEWLLALVTIALSSAVALTLAEYGLRQLDRHIASSDRMEPGLIRYHPRWGWALTPSWRGNHEHYDFNARYTINTNGFRGRRQTGADTGIALVGDSFTFGLGVDDDSTFAAVLDRRLTETLVLNYSIPGFSTDQQLLLAEERILPKPPQQVLLLAYLANDVFDNAREYPLQAEHAKPYFELKGGDLTLRNQPVPRVAKPSAQRRINLGAYLKAGKKTTGLSAYLREFALWRRFGPAAEGGLSLPTFTARFEPELRLFYALVSRFKDKVRGTGAEFKLVLLAGASHAQHPDSDSARFQEYFRAEISQWATANAVPLIDVAEGLRHRYARAPGGWFFPNDGHLTPLGHEVVADMLAEALTENH